MAIATAPSILDPVQGGIDEARRLTRQGAPVREVLWTLASAVDSLWPDRAAAASILVLDHLGLLRDGASPRLPGDYLRAIDGLQPQPGLGTCAAAAATGSIVFTPDFREDSKWAELRHLPLAIGYRGAWSHPIKSAAGCVLGTFGTYFRDSRLPSQPEMDAVALAAAVAAEAITGRRATPPFPHPA